MQVMKEQLNKYIEILKKYQAKILKIKNSINKIKNTVEISPVGWVKLKMEYQGLKTRHMC
jgi:hypothetical protein